jgi:uncharacterized membrane protein
MSEARHLWVIGFDNMDQAERVRAEILKLGESHCLILLDTAEVVRYPDGCLAAPPLTGAAAGALVRGFGGGWAEVGIDDSFVTEVEKLMRPGSSALFVLDRAGDMAAILKGIRGLGGKVLKTNVDLQRAQLIQTALAAL